MRIVGIAGLFISSIFPTTCAGPKGPPPPLPPQTFTTSFWFWQGSSYSEDTVHRPLDSLYVHVASVERRSTPFAPAGRAEPRWYSRGEVPYLLPPAHNYWLVFRLDPASLGDDSVYREITTELKSQLDYAAARNRKIAGVQFDVDQPTNSLSQYARFLIAIRKQLPPNLQLSITALLDWFRPGTAIADVIAAVDEFVPQFYDAGANDGDHFTIAKRIDQRRWAPVFNRFHKPYRIGISTFGRMRLTHSSGREHQAVTYYGDISPLEMAANPDFAVSAGRNNAGELVIAYRAIRPTRFSYRDLAPGDSVDFVVATPESVRDAVAAAREMKGYVAGVVFFRWPAGDEALSMAPAEILAPQTVPGEPTVESVDGQCAAVRCTELYLLGVQPFAPQAARYRISSSAPLEYFVPQEKMPVRMTGAHALDLQLPPYCARGRLRLGRAVALADTRFRVEKLQ